ncbi:putative aflatoxin biosynthesis ketoreductase nor-1 protein [Phaeoacremonium minimum UCRPA7]|uniref:Putative aflatoxin biosynthesis ketoreductase nor-1 protein n=1 Tax=Phaeoacremonium minimum (strain UCR-PA7) TaxID=1286976 RepID=R8BGK8_PHAM7|nr:putative aflatoxin biosynthesis ketoreductase nor-1 protein [Phaeoacremonium minimum UCRPA7]EON98424.1 putative aflatoxin biosynthesis ketoreductase nor-1 protein [Phaeoacremonium minimum UCRPA7]
MSTTPKTYLITGANRGIGKGFVEMLLQRPGTTVIATARDPAKAVTSLNELPKATGSRLLIVKLDAQVDADAARAVSQLRQEHSVTSIDVVIANAGISHSGAPVIQNSAEALRDHFNINTIGPVTLFQAVYPLLKASLTRNPIFLPISTMIGSIGCQESLSALPATFCPYGASKAALNWIVSRIHYEEPWLTTWAAHPGLVLTDMVAILTSQGVDPTSIAAISVETSVSGILRQVDEGTREKHGGKLRSHDGTTLPW